MWHHKMFVHNLTKNVQHLFKKLRLFFDYSPKVTHVIIQRSWEEEFDHLENFEIFYGKGNLREGEKIEFFFQGTCKCQIYIGETGTSCNSFYSNLCSVKSVEYLELLFISFGSPLVTLERNIFKLTKGYLMSKKIEPKWACYNSPRIKICEERCNTTCRGEVYHWLIFNIILLKWLEFYKNHFILFVLYLWHVFAILSAGSIFVNFPKNSKQITYHHNQFFTWQKNHFAGY